MKQGKDLLIAKENLYTSKELEIIANELEFEQNCKCAGDIERIHFVEITKEVFNLLFALQNEHGIFSNLNVFQKLIKNIGIDLNLTNEYIELVFDKYYYALIREGKRKAKEAKLNKKYVPIDDFEVMNERIEEARIEKLEADKEIQQERPGYDI